MSTSSLPTSTSPLPGPTSTENTVSVTSSPNGSVRVGPIVGGVIGGLGLLVFTILGLFLLRRRHKRNVSSTRRPFDNAPLHLSSTISNTSSAGLSYSQLAQTLQLGSHVTYRVNGQTSHASMPGVTSTDSTEPPSLPSGVIANPTNLHAVPLPKTASNLANSPSSSSPLASMPGLSSSESAQLEPLPHIVEREAEALDVPSQYTPGRDIF
jgi:hypothetical protein